MGKNAHPPRSNGKKKAAQPDDDLGSNVVFTNDLSEEKAKPAQKQPSDSQQGDVSKKLDTRVLIGGASWTGKLPVNLLSEHCQKQRWERPEYTMRKTPDGFSSMVILKSKNLKTQELNSLPPLKLPPTHLHLVVQPTAVEARHYAATYALFRISSHKNISTVLPPAHRDLWRELQELKKEDVKDGKAWMYEADPFLVQREREQAHAQAEQKREKQKKENQTTTKEPGAGASGSSSNNMRGWKTVAKVEMGSKTRKAVERVIRDMAQWNPHQDKLSQHSRAKVIDELQKLGFRKSHVEEAADTCRDREEILEWLIVHVPEDDLPSWCLPENYSAGVQMASSNMKREATIERLACGGFSREICLEAFQTYGGDEGRAAQSLQDSLLGVPSSGTAAEGTLDDSDWREEQETLSAIYADRCEHRGPAECRVRLETTGIKQAVHVNFRKPCRAYPANCPVVSIDARLPAYIRLSATRQALQYAQEELRGTQMIFSIVDWFENNLLRVIDNPGRLADVSSVSSSAATKVSQGKQRNLKNRRHPMPLKQEPGTPRSMQLFTEWQKRQSTPKQQKMLSGRQSLPAWKLQESIVAAVNTNQVVIISGETGSGKSTQSVQFILDDRIRRQLGDATNMICTQPRRISALGLAERVADERCSQVGQEIGYAIRGESRQTPGITKCTFVTTGILLRRLQTSDGSTQDLVASLQDVSHVFLDEVHERDLNTDFLLALLRDVLVKRKDLKLILMSATLDASVFETYFGGSQHVGRVEIQGRAFPVEDLYLDDVARLSGRTQTEDETFDEVITMGRQMRNLGFGTNYDLICDLVMRIDEELGDREGAILIFLSGTLEIKRALDTIAWSAPMFYALPLHASLLPSDQRKVFSPAPPGRRRKVIASTNVAETSITIPDVVAVIDTGKVKETRYDAQSKMVKLEEVWVSRAAAKQRRGRAGRVSAGKCYKLYTRNAEAKMAERPEPEIRRTPLEQLCLSVKAMGIENVPHFIASTLTPPEQLAVESALALLRTMRAMDGNTLTALGRHMSMIPADLRCAKLLVLGTLFDVLEPCLTVAAILSVRSPFISPQDKREESRAAKMAFALGHGDVAAELRAYEAWSTMRTSSARGQVRQWCEQNFLSVSTLQDINSTRAQLFSTLVEIGLISPVHRAREPLSQTPDVLLNCLILSGLYPQTLRISFPAQRYQATISGALAVDPESREIKYFDADNERVFIHPSSTLFSASSYPNNAGFLSYFKKVATSKNFVRELTPTGSYGLLLFGGLIEVDTQGRGLVVDGWIRLRGWARIGVLVSRLRYILDSILDRWVEEPGTSLTSDEARVISIVRKLAELEGLDH